MSPEDRTPTAHGPSDDANVRRRRGGRLALSGRLQTFAGSTLMLAGVGIGSAAGNVSQGDPARPGLWIALLSAVVCGALGVPLFHRGRRARVHGDRLGSATIDSFETLARQRYVLYLRPFDLDAQTAELPTEPPSRWWASDFHLSRKTHEEQMMRWFAGLGPSIAVGRPGEPLPLTGARRGYLGDGEWKEVVGALIARAHVVLLAVGPKPGTVWEFTEALRTTEPGRLVLLVCHRPEPYERFRHMVAGEYERRARTEPGPWPAPPRLPDYPALRHPGRRSWDYGLKGVITFDPDWKATFTRFDPTQPLVPITLIINGIQRRGMRPVRARLAELPARSRATG
ncbi:hypothetical protein H7827_26575 [Streptomyces sp. JH002]|uniref:hypothetical protein n=1 Tax=Streptomyces sp. JH002 TaxID=2763259 RepID=UPI003D803660